MLCDPTRDFAYVPDFQGMPLSALPLRRGLLYPAELPGHNAQNEV